MSIGFNEEFDIQSLQKRLREMSDEKLLQFGRDAKYMCSPYANMGQLEWRRRHIEDKS
jgi:hypothetical protein